MLFESFSLAAWNNFTRFKEHVSENLIEKHRLYIVTLAIISKLGQDIAIERNKICKLCGNSDLPL